MKCISEPEPVATVNSNTADAEGVPKPKVWYIVIVPRMKEKVLGNILSGRGIRYFLPIQQKKTIDRKGNEVLKEHFLFYSKVFVYITPAERKVLNREGVFHRFLIDIASKPDSFGRRPPAIVPDHQMQAFIQMLSQSETPVSLEEYAFCVGDRVRVIAGPLEGFEGTITHCTDGNSYLSIMINHLGCAKMKIDSNLVTRLE